MFTLRGGMWSRTAVLAAARPAPFDLFGQSVALSAGGSTALVGAIGHPATGSSHVFT